MKLYLKSTMLAAGLISAGISSMAVAGGPPGDFVVSQGESSLVLACFYECKPGAVVQGIPTWQEVTTLMITNISPVPAPVGVYFSDGNENRLAKTFFNLSEEDLDELNVCRTLQNAGVPVPQAGLVEIVVDAPPIPEIGVYAWVKNLIGKFFVTQNEPFAGRVTGIAKTECRLVPESVISPQRIRDKFVSAPSVPPILVEDTADEGGAP